MERHFRAYPRTHRDVLPVGGVLQWRRDGERHVWNPDTIAKLQHAVRSNDGTDGSEPVASIRARPRRIRAHDQRPGGAEVAAAGADEARVPTNRAGRGGRGRERDRQAVLTGAMSLGRSRREAHETLAIAMNRLGARSNTGEGERTPSRYVPDPNGDSRRSAIKQVASGRFGVTARYLIEADQLQIKVAQGAKPGEGGQLPGPKIDGYIGELRFSTPASN